VDFSQRLDLQEEARNIGIKLRSTPSEGGQIGYNI